MSRASSRRGLLMVALLLTGLLVVIDLMRHDSLLARAWSALTPEPTTPVQERIRDIRRSR